METKIDLSNTPKSLFRDKEHYLAFVAAFKKSAQRKNLSVDSEADLRITAAHYAFYALMRNRDWRKCFTSCTNKNKIACNGRKPYDTLNSTLATLRGMLKARGIRNGYGSITISDSEKARAERELAELNKVFGGTLTSEMLEKVFEFLPQPDASGETCPNLYDAPKMMGAITSKEVAHV